MKADPDFIPEFVILSDTTEVTLDIIEAHADIDADLESIADTDPEPDTLADFVIVVEPVILTDLIGVFVLLVEKLLSNDNEELADSDFLVVIEG